jgi:1-acyl-sn-glycerol-3-phosphate acyltransferase
MIRSLAFNAYFYIGTLLVAVVGILLVPVPTPVLLRGLLFHWARAVAWGMRWIGGMRVEFRGLHHLPAKGPALLANKHHSESDGILLAAQIRGIAFVAMQELFRYPLIGAILYRLQMIRVDTCGGGRERENLAQFARRAYESGRHIAIYPEGNLMAPGERERYRSGIYYLYRDLGLPVTPVATSVGLLWNRRDWRKRSGRAAVEFLPAIETGLDKETFMRRLEDTIETATDRLIAEFTGRPYQPSQLVLRSQGQAGIGAPITAPRAAP